MTLQDLANIVDEKFSDITSRVANGVEPCSIHLAYVPDKTSESEIHNPLKNYPLLLGIELGYGDKETPTISLNLMKEGYHRKLALMEADLAKVPFSYPKRERQSKGINLKKRIEGYKTTMETLLIFLGEIPNYTITNNNKHFLAMEEKQND
jgi:hypothetical protein